MSNLVEKVQSIYAAFGRGDVPAILEHLSPEVEWEYATGVDHGVPWLRPRRGRDGAAAFFAAAGAELEFRAFSPHTFVQGPSLVIVLVDLEVVVRKTGRALAERDELHLWRFDGAGRVVGFRHGVDSAAHVAAWQA